jgi:glycosyltransferase involved in cell wall biosynthesis
LEKETTIYIINGSSLGGGEIDSIIRVSLCGGLVLSLKPPVAKVLQFAARHGVVITSMREVWCLPMSTKLLFVSNGFIRDLTLTWFFLSHFLRRGRRVSLLLVVHSDPKNMVGLLTSRMKIGLMLYQLFGLVFAKRVRFVSERQISSFAWLARFKPYYVDPPTSPITRQFSTVSVYANLNERSLHFTFLGRLSKSSILGDAKNSDFVLAFSSMLETEPEMLAVFACGNRSDIITGLQAHKSTQLHDPTDDVFEVLTSAKVVLIPSFHEGYCLLAREASLLGCQVLTTKAIAPELQTLGNVHMMQSFDSEMWLEKARSLVS